MVWHVCRYCKTFTSIFYDINQSQEEESLVAFSILDFGLNPITLDEGWAMQPNSDST